MANQVNNKLIAKNTIVLYIRTLFVMLISLYTSRVVLETLGVEDYGIYQVVGGIVAMFSVISSSLSNAISRFLTFEIGNGDKIRLENIFSTSISIQIFISFIVLILSEVIGVWFIETKMQIPFDRIDIAKWVFHFSLFTFCINLLSVPYNACIIAHERMNAFAYIGVFEAVMKLAICYMIKLSFVDKLFSYALLMTLLALSIRIIYGVYCKRHFEECRVKAGFDKDIFKEMIGFSGWSFFNNTAYILNGQGINMLMNVYFGVIVNAARGIAIQVEGAVLQFVNNFTTAINPQITKSYASGDIENMHRLVCRGAKFSYYSMLFLALPIILEAEQILRIWLVEVPNYTVKFVQLSLIMGLCDSIGNSGYTACMATGKLKKYSLVITSVAILEFPLAWTIFSIGGAPTYAYYIYIIIKISILIIRAFLLENMVGLKVKTYIKDVFSPIILTTVVAVLAPLLVSLFYGQCIVRLILIIISSSISVSLSALFLGMTSNERFVIMSSFKNVVSKFTRRYL